MSTADALRGAPRQGRASARAGPRASWWRGWRCSCTCVKEGIRDVHETAVRSRSRCRSSRRWSAPGDREATRAWCARVLGMYRAWAGNRHMQLSELAGAAPGEPAAARDQRLRCASPARARGGTARAGGARRRGPRPGHGARAAGRGAARRSAAGQAAALRSWPRCRPGAPPHAVVRRYRSDPSPLVRNMNGSWRSGRLDAVLGGDFDLIAAREQT